MNNPRDDKPLIKDPHTINKESTESPALKDEEFEEGVDSNDNALDRAHKMGLYQDADEEHPHELDIAKEVEKAEKDNAGIQNYSDNEMPKKQE